MNNIFKESFIDKWTDLIPDGVKIFNNIFKFHYENDKLIYKYRVLILTYE